MEAAIEHSQSITINGYSLPPALDAFYRLFNEMNTLRYTNLVFIGTLM